MSEVLEAKARESWIRSVDLEGEMHELVALGMIQGDDVVWYELPNVAEPNADGRGEFLVDGEAIRETIMRAYAELNGHGALVPAEMEVYPWDAIVLWHTHTGSVSPSAEDVAEFPDWLAQVGLVYHVPSGTTTAYNSAGIIPDTLGVQGSLATTGE